MIDSGRVEDIFKDCLFREDEMEDGHPIEFAKLVPVDGIMTKFGLHKERLDGHRVEVEGMLGQLPDEFMAGKGGGMSFLRACYTNTGEQWTGFHMIIEQLFALGMALGRVRYAIAVRNMWKMFPGGMPYMIVDLRGE